jgi:hypothetical protein
MSRLLVGFDSAWTATNAGAIVGAVLDADGAIRELGHPTRVRYEEAAGIVQEWQASADDDVEHARDGRECAEDGQPEEVDRS